MSGALSQQLIFPTYGQKIVGQHPPAITYFLPWVYVNNGAPGPPGLVVYPQTLVGTLFAYGINLNNIVREGGRIPTIQSIYVDNSANNVDVRVSVNQTNVEFIAPAFTAGMYPLICGQSPTIILSVTEQPEGSTTIDLFAEMLPAYMVKQGKRGALRPSQLQSYVDPCPSPITIGSSQSAIPFNWPNTFTSNINAVLPCFTPATLGRLVLHAVNFDVVGRYVSISGGPVGLSIALMECLSAGTNGWYYNPILIHTLILDPTACTGNAIQTFPPYSARFDPPYIGVYCADPTKLAGPANHLPMLAWATGASPGIGSLFVNTRLSVGSVPAGYGQVNTF